MRRQRSRLSSSLRAFARTAALTTSRASVRLSPWAAAAVSVLASRNRAPLAVVDEMGVIAWPVAAVAVAVWRRGHAWWPTLLCACFAWHSLYADTWGVAASAALLDAIAGGAAGACMARTPFRPALARVPDVVLLCLVGGVVAGGTAAAWAAMLAALGGALSEAAPVLGRLSMSAALGFLGFSPALFTWQRRGAYGIGNQLSALRNLGNPLDLGLFGLAVVMTSVGEASAWLQQGAHDGPLSTWMFVPVLLWAATRFGQRGTGTCLAIGLSGQLVAAARAPLHWAAGGLAEVAIGWQMGLCAVVMASLLLGSLVEERRATLRLRDEFLLVASHELKTPLTALLLGVENLSRCLRKKPEARSGDPLHKLAAVQGHAQRMAHLVEELLQFSHDAHEALRLDRKPCEVGALLRRAAHLMDSRSEQSGSTIECITPQAVYGLCDDARLTQLLQVLLDNACKYGAGKPIEMSLRSDARYVHITVEDHGIGIARGELRRIFSQFERAVSARSYGGLGLGLYLARRIARAHGGDLWAEHGEPKGARFVVRLPRGNVGGAIQVPM